MEYYCKNQRTAGIAQFLRRYYAEHKKRVTLANFIAEAKKSRKLTLPECKKIFDYCTSGKECLVLWPGRSRVFQFTCHQDHFNDKFVDDMLELLNISHQIDKGYVALVNKKHKPIIDKPIKLEKVNTEQLISHFSTDELLRELKSRGYDITLHYVGK